jgi:signal transduction histidine kinase
MHVHGNRMFCRFLFQRKRLPRAYRVCYLFSTFQVSFLHVYHHTSIAWAWWLGLKLFPGGDAYFGALLNSWIHVMMYSYYTFSLLKISCPWKRYLTQAQLLQFASVVTYSVIGSTLYLPAGSWREYTAHAIQDFEMISLFVLFLHFYRKAYSSKKDKKEEAAQKQQGDEVKAAAATATRASVSTLLPPMVLKSSSPSPSIATDSDAGSDMVTEQDSLMDSSDEDEETD